MTQAKLAELRHDFILLDQELLEVAMQNLGPKFGCWAVATGHSQKGSGVLSLYIHEPLLLH